ncbi:hypothetical protein MMC18_002807 [Xylographa bjoerkii]|nr:hypothetical protein [Xylographa bjoerkii]
MLLSPTQADELASEISNQDSILEPREDVSSVPFHTERSEPPQKQESEAAQSRNPTSIAPPQHLEAVAQTPSIYQAPGACDVVWRLNALNLRQQEEIANLIILNCQMACFEFYTAEALWRTKFSKDTYAGPKLFDCQDGSSAKYHTDFSLREWISKVRHAWGLRVNDQDTCRYLAIFNGKDFYDTMSDAGRIPSVLLPWGGVDTDYCGPALEVAIRFHEHLKSCDSQARLKRLLTLVRKPSGDINFTYLHPTPKATPVDMREDYIVASQSK